MDLPDYAGLKCKRCEEQLRRPVLDRSEELRRKNLGGPVMYAVFKWRQGSEIHHLLCSFHYEEEQTWRTTSVRSAEGPTHHTYLPIEEVPPEILQNYELAIYDKQLTRGNRKWG